MGTDTSESVSSHQTLRLLSIPRRSHENKYFAKLLGALERRDIRVVEPRWAELLLFRYDVLKLNFPTHHITENRLLKAGLLSLVFAAYLLAARIMQRTIIYTVHDVVPLRLRHTRLLAAFLRLTHWAVDGFVFLSHSSQQMFAARYPEQQRKPWALAPHGPYDAAFLPPSERAAARLQLTGDAHVFLVGFLGAIKPYKNLEALQQLPAYLPDGRKVHVVVAGRVEAGYEAAAAETLRAIPSERLTRIDQRLTDAALNRLIQTVDLVLLPYASGSNSGAALLVLSNHGRLAGSGLSMFRELVERVGAPWVYALSSQQPALGYRDLLTRAAQDRINEEHRLALAAYLDSIGFVVSAQAIDGLICELRSQPHVFAAARQSAAKPMADA